MISVKRVGHFRIGFMDAWKAAIVTGTNGYLCASWKLLSVKMMIWLGYPGLRPLLRKTIPAGWGALGVMGLIMLPRRRSHLRSSPPLAAAVGWLIVSHHRLSAQ